MDILGGQSRACTVSSNIFWHFMIKSPFFLAVGQIPKYIPYSCLQWDKLPGVKLCWKDLGACVWLGGWDTCIFSLARKKNPHEMCLVMRVVWVLLYPKTLGKKEKRKKPPKPLAHAAVGMCMSINKARSGPGAASRWAESSCQLRELLATRAVTKWEWKQIPCVRITASTEIGTRYALYEDATWFILQGMA